MNPKTRESTTHPPLELEAFTVAYPRFTLGPLSLGIDAGERVALVGPNGAGKSTLMAAMAGRLPRYGGSLRFAAHEMRDAIPAVREHIGFLAEETSAYRWMTVRQHFDLHAQFFPNWDDHYAQELTQRLKIDDLAKMNTLSRGTAVKVGFVLAEAHRPAVLLLDEPTTGLDPFVRGELLSVLREALAADPTRVLVFSTHLLEDIEPIAHRVVALRDGKLDQDTSVLALSRSMGQGSVASALYERLGA